MTFVLNITANKHRMCRRESRCLLYIGKKQAGFCLFLILMGESNGKLPLSTCAGCSVPEPYRSPDWALVPAKPALGLNTNYYYYYYINAGSEISDRIS
jgi:hypothetical protein